MVGDLSWVTRGELVFQFSFYLRAHVKRGVSACVEVVSVVVVVGGGGVCVGGGGDGEGGVLLCCRVE